MAEKIAIATYVCSDESCDLEQAAFTKQEDDALRGIIGSECPRVNCEGIVRRTEPIPLMLPMLEKLEIWFIPGDGSFLVRLGPYQGDEEYRQQIAIDGRELIFMTVADILYLLQKMEEEGG